MLTTRYGSTPASRAAEAEDEENLATAISKGGWNTTGRWFDFDRNSDGSFEVLERGMPVGRIDSLDEAESFIDWITQ